MIAARRFACAAPAVRAQRSDAAISLTKLPKIVVSRPICDAMLCSFAVKSVEQAILVAAQLSLDQFTHTNLVGDINVGHHIPVK